MRTDEERMERALDIDANLHTFIAEKMVKKLVEAGVCEYLEEEVLSLLFEMNVEFDLKIPEDAFWSVRIERGEDGDVRIQIMPQAIIDETVKTGNGLQVAHPV